MKSKVQTIAVTLRFDKEVTAPEARKLFKDCVWGEFYPCELDSTNGAGSMKIGKVAPVKL